MNRSRTASTSLGLALGLGLLCASPAAASPTRPNNPSALSIVLTCPAPIGVIQGSAGPGAQFLLDTGAAGVLSGLADANGEIISQLNPGLDRQGRLIQCTYDSRQFGPGTQAFVFFIPRAG